jgi:uncharacterized membrane protein
MQDGISGISGTGREGDPPFPQFPAILLPHRSLSRKGFVAPMLAAGSPSLLAAAAFGSACPSRVSRLSCSILLSA